MIPKKPIAKPARLPMRICLGVCALRYNREDITAPAATMANAVGHNKDDCSSALFKGNSIPIPPQIAKLCTLTF